MSDIMAVGWRCTKDIRNGTEVLVRRRARELDFILRDKNGALLTCHGVQSWIICLETHLQTRP